MSCNFEYYKIFYYVARYKKFTLAAKLLLTSQPSITRSIQNLESELGCKLFNRSVKGVSLTQEGTYLYSAISSSCETLINSEKQMADKLLKKKETVTIGSTETAIHCYLLKHLQNIQECFPHIRLKIVNAGTLLLLDKLKKGQIDLALITSPFEKKQFFKFMNLHELNDFLIAGNHYNVKTTMNLKDVQNESLIGLTEDTVTFQFYNDFFASFGLSFNPDISLATTDLLLPMIKNNLGIGFVPKEMAQEAIDHHEVKKIDLVESIPKRFICVAQNADKTTDQTIEELLSILIQK